jgi:hypothetical protein
VPHGQVINAYWDHMKNVYTPLEGKPESDRVAALRWGPGATTPKDRTKEMKLKTLNNTGPGALETALGKETIRGQSVARLIRPDYAYDVHTNDGRHLLLDPKYVYVRSDNSWVKAIDAAQGGPGTPA